MIEDATGRLVAPPNPAMALSQRVTVECGCTVWIGMRLDRMEPAVLAMPCDFEHKTVAIRFNTLLGWAFEANGMPDDLAETVEELLETSAAMQDG